jgi:hypothetical protein
LQNQQSQPKTTTTAQQLLLCVSRPFVDEERRERVQMLLRAGIDWEYLTNTAVRHGIVPLLHFHLSKISNGEVPPEVTSFLEKETQKNTELALLLTGELIRLLKAFEKHRIEAIPWKGPTLAAVAYGDIGLRQFVDLDLFVWKEDMPRVNEILARIGFDPSPQDTRQLDAALLRFDCARNFSNGGIFADVHWAYSPPHLSLTLQPDPLRQQPVNLGSQQTATLSPEDLLLALSIHGFTHYWERLAWVADVGALIARDEVDWNALMTKARRFGLLRVLAVAVLLAHELLDISPAVDVLESLRRVNATVKLTRMFQRAMFEYPRGSNSTISIIKLHLKIRERFRDKLLTFVRFALTPRTADLRTVHLPTQLHSFYYLVRPIRLLCKYFSTFARRFFGPSQLHSDSVAERYD